MMSTAMSMKERTTGMPDVMPPSSVVSQPSSPSAEAAAAIRSGTPRRRRWSAAADGAPPPPWRIVSWSGRRRRPEQSEAWLSAMAWEQQVVARMPISEPEPEPELLTFLGSRSGGAHGVAGSRRDRSRNTAGGSDVLGFVLVLGAKLRTCVFTIIAEVVLTAGAIIELGS